MVNLLIGLSVAVVVILLFYFLSKVKDKTTAELFKTESEDIGTTSEGVKLKRLKGSGITLSTEVKMAIDSGMLTNRLIAFKCREFKKDINLNEWTFFILPSHPSPKYATPSYYYPYPKSQEKSNNMIVAGEFIPDLEKVIAIADPKGDNVFTFQVSLNETEHGYEYNELGRMPSAYPNHVHPVWDNCLGQGDALASEAPSAPAVKPKHFSCGCKEAQ